MIMPPAVVLMVVVVIDNNLMVLIITELSELFFRFGSYMNSSLKPCWFPAILSPSDCHYFFNSFHASSVHGVHSIFLGSSIVLAMIPRALM